MTQVGSIMPEGAVTLTPTPTVTPAPLNVPADAVSTATAGAAVQVATTNSSAVQLLKAANKDQQNGEKKSEGSAGDAGGSTPVVKEPTVAASTADGPAKTERNENDSQITSSSTENGADGADKVAVSDIADSADAKSDSTAIGTANGAKGAGKDVDAGQPHSPAATLTSTTVDIAKEAPAVEVVTAPAKTEAVPVAKAKDVDTAAKPSKSADADVESSTSTSKASDAIAEAPDGRPACGAAPKSSVAAATRSTDAKDNDEGVSSTSDSQPQTKQLEKPSTKDCDKSVAKSLKGDATKAAPEEEITSNAVTPLASAKQPADTKNTKTRDSCGDAKAAGSGDEPMDTSAENPLAIDKTVPKAVVAAQRENGSASVAEKARNDSAIVDLDSDEDMEEDDDDDDEDDDEEEAMVPKPSQHESAGKSGGDGVKPNGDSSKLIAHPPPDSTHKSRSLCSDSDGAVVIGSDSENEATAHMPSLKPLSIQKQAPHLVEDDDDDCVVIEDDTPMPMASDLTKRKSLAMDSANNSDDSQPPTKRQRNAPQSQPQSSANQITIKDARSLMPQELSMKKVCDANIYPVNITPASNMVQSGPPKLVPMSSASNMSNMGLPQGLTPMPGLSPVMGVMPTLGTNSNLLPGLTDDMFVLEAPSFIVPYIYEKPPPDSLREIVKEIETTYKLSREDLAEADKPDEFDMMTEQNKEDKEEKEDKNGKKKNKRRRGNDQDDSWSEESDDDDDDDDDEDSESGIRTKVLIKEASDDLNAIKGAIKPAAAVTQSSIVGGSKPGQENYFESPLGKFFMDIGVGLVQEYVQSDLIRLQKRKMRKSLGKNITEFERAITALSGNLEASRKKNSSFKFTLKRCEFCQFKSESALAMANHYETPHMNGLLYKCNFCPYEIRSNTEIVYHMEAVHNIKARLVKPLPYHQCPNCGFEDNGKAKLARHQPVCVKKFRPELNLAPPADWEAPAKIPRIKPRHGLVGTATAYQAMAAQAAAQKAALASIQHQQQQAAQARSFQAAALAVQNAAKIRGRPPVAAKPGPVPMAGTVVRGANQVRSPMPNNVVMSNNYQLSGGQIVQQTANAMAKKALTGQPSISITPLPRQTAASPAPTPSTSKMPPAGLKPGQSPTGTSKAQFVICEICDGYIKDLEQLRNHMQWMHKVKIHPKMIFNRPPLNCQKCQFRFFTDQGLERHLLGSHGLVTSSMQEAANKAKDGGRCPVCGRMYQWKLLNHVSRDHHMTLKPAHLSYKCTVCTATFGMYKQFETHVYTAHSTVAKKAMDGKKNAAAGGAGASGGPQQMQRNSLTASNDSLLKPLKINDEITIIPQPASKPRITNTESHVID